MALRVLLQDSGPHAGEIVITLVSHRALAAGEEGTSRLLLEHTTSLI